MIRGNEKGLSLVEALAVLVIGSIVMIFMFNIVVSGMNTSNQIKERSSIHNEANFLLVVLREFHERGNPYEIEQIDGTLIIKEVDTGYFQTEFNRFTYDVSIAGYEIRPKENESQKTVPITITITSKNYSGITYTTKTILQRL